MWYMSKIIYKSIRKDFIGIDTLKSFQSGSRSPYGLLM